LFFNPVVHVGCRDSGFIMTPEEMVRRLLYRDGLMLVLDKPAGFAVHRGPKGGESLEDYFGALTFGLPRAPALAHRLDRDTSGCLVLGRHRKALAELGKLFKNGRMGKTYWAVVEGGPAEDEGRVELPLGRLDDSRGWWMKHDPDGQASTTVWKVLGRSCGSVMQTATANSVTSPWRGEVAERSEAGGGDSALKSPHPGGFAADPPPPGGGKLTWLALEPLTGRTHQLRVHCAAMGWPIVGDAIYGSAPRTGGPILHLHAREVIVPLYKNRPPVRVEAPVPPHMRERLMQCGWPGEAETAVPSPALANANKASP
jgi:tRNA pseudouridine32 synthase / 23S rRNA pseudouridine746 synthase